MAYESLFKPLRIRSVEIENRIAMAPINMMYTDHDRPLVNDQVLAHYAARARGGAGLIIIEAVLATRQAAKFPAFSNLTMYDQMHTQGLDELAETIHSFGAKAFVQLSPGFGRQGRAHTGEAPPAPSAIPYSVEADMLPKSWKPLAKTFPPPYKGDMPHEMTVEEIKQELAEYNNSVVLAVLSGFDGLELHVPHGYLGHQFLSPRSNKRTDEYGGSLENRMRFIVELTENTVKTVRSLMPGFVVGIRLSSEERMPDGFGLEDTIAVMKRVEEIGVDYYHLSDGCYEAMKYLFPEEDGTMLEAARAFKRVLKIPVITPSIYDPAMAETAVNEGATDMVSLGRQLIADPDWPLKVKAGRVKDIVRCHRDDFCVQRFMTGLPVRCNVNPNVGRERFMPEYGRPKSYSGTAALPAILRQKPESKAKTGPAPG